MSRSIELSDDIYQQLEAEAFAAGTTPAEWIAAQLSNDPAIGNGTGVEADASASDATVKVDLTSSIYGRLRESASKSGRSIEQWISDRLPPAPRILLNRNGEPARNLAEAMEGLIGTYSSEGNEDLAENHSALFGEYLEEKRRAGHL